jgi:hypothetical protein
LFVLIYLVLISSLTTVIVREAGTSCKPRFRELPSQSGGDHYLLAAWHLMRHEISFQIESVFKKYKRTLAVAALETGELETGRPGFDSQ